jgi:hypothetical protein
MQINLDAFRCPDATIYMRRAIKSFEEQANTHTLTLVTIEPSMERSLRHLLEDKPALTLGAAQQTPITHDLRQTWADNFDEEDHEDVHVVYTFTITRHAVT